MILIAKSAFFCTVDGVERFIPQGMAVRSDHPIVEGRQDYFKPLPLLDEDVESGSDGAAPAVEQATAAPGENRTLSNPPAKRGPGRPRKNPV